MLYCHLPNSKISKNGQNLKFKDINFLKCSIRECKKLIFPNFRSIAFLAIFFLLSALFRISFLCWDRWNSDGMPTLDTDLLCSSRAGSDLIWSDWFEELFILITHICESRDHRTCYSGYSLPKRDSIRRRRVMLLMKQALCSQATTAGS